MDEAFDYWYRPKGGNPHCSLFLDTFREDTKAMVQDAYNHPCVVIYSIGNEIPEAGSMKGVRVGKEIVDVIHSIDITRPVTLCPSVHWLREYLDGMPYLTRDEDEWMAESPENKEKDWKHYMKIFMGAAANIPENEKDLPYPPLSCRWMRMPRKTFILIWTLRDTIIMRINMILSMNFTRNVFCWARKPGES